MAQGDGGIHTGQLNANRGTSWCGRGSDHAAESSDRLQTDSVNLSNLEKLADVLGCDPGYLIVKKGK